ncbi:MAG: hypothetical protein IKD83_05275, partial [Firmicutes bacterium]|nr:hypothetical protein [Bacillota bacterium]
MNRSIPIFKDYEVNRRPKTSKEFEDLVRKCALVKLGNRFSLFGRNGQNQKGIDIYSEDWGTVIQCKCFDFEKKGSVQRLIEEGKRDYQEAVRAFGDTMKTFVIATTLNTDTKIQENFKDNTSTGEIELWFWEDIKEIIETYQINNANDIYVNSFIKPLFLHKDEKYRGKVCLKNLFILQKYRDIKGDDSSKDVKADLEDRLSRFINVDKDSNILIIEGDAGCGKSSLIGWLNYHANEDDAISKHVLGQRNLITIRLRDLKKETINNNNSLKDAIVEYMNIKFLGGID